jgi:hypothetical protein
MLCAVAHNDLGGAIRQVVVGGQFVRNRLTQLRDACARRVFGKSGLQCIDGGFFYVFGRVEVRFACAEAAHINAFSLHGFGFAINRESEGRSQLSGAFRNFHGINVIEWERKTIGVHRSFQSEV